MATVLLASNIIQFVGFSCSLVATGDEDPNNKSSPSPTTPTSPAGSRDTYGDFWQRQTVRIRELTDALAASNVGGGFPGSSGSGAGGAAGAGAAAGGNGVTTPLGGVTPANSFPPNFSRSVTATGGPPQARTHIDSQLNEIAADCQTTSKELQTLLLSLGQQGRGRVKNFVQAARVVWERKQVDALVLRIRDLQDLMSETLLAMLTDSRSELCKRLDSIVIENNRMEMQRVKHFESLREELANMIKSIVPNRRQTTAVGQFVATLSDSGPVDLAELKRYADTLHRLPSKMMELMRETEAIAAEQKVLASLCHSSLKTRQENIRAAHETTFEWIYDNDQRAQLLEWLESGFNTYWVMGKPGSGKSTLMKYIATHPRTKQALTKWAGGKKLITANYFFYNPGSRFQKSQEGLLQTLLFHVLRQCPHLIKDVCSEMDVHSSSQGMTESRPRSELLTAFKLLMRQTENSTKFCFFIDGLDEYAGNTQDLIARLNELNESSFIKLCVASRPWNEFKDAFGKVPERMLQLEDLTKEDIRKYIEGKLNNNAIFKQHPNRKELTQELVDKAKGVFLWVWLAVDLLLDGLQAQNTPIDDLKARIDALPKTLEEFFQHMLDSVDPSLRKKTTRLLRVAWHAAEPLSLITYSYLDQEYTDPDYAFHVRSEYMTKVEIMERQHAMRTDINERCKGLLEIPEPDAVSKSLGLFFAYKVEFLHRTARDFLETARKDIVAQEPEDNAEADDLAATNLHESICKAYLAQLKTVPSDRYRKPGWETVAGPNNPVDVLLAQLVQHALESERDRGVAPVKVLDAAEKVIEKHRLGWYSRGRYGDFLNFCKAKKLTVYVDERVLRDPTLVKPHERPALDRAIDRLDPMLVLEVLEKGGKPNERWICNADGSPYQPQGPPGTASSASTANTIMTTPWIRFLNSVQTGRFPTDDRVLKVLDHLLRYGADTHARTCPNGPKAKDIICLRFPDSGKPLLKKNKRASPPPWKRWSWRMSWSPGTGSGRSSPLPSFH